MGTEFEMELIDDEILDMESDAVITTGGGGSVTSYNPLTDKPKINGVTLIGNKSFEDLGLNSVVNAEVDSYVEAHKEELKGNPGDPGADGISPAALIERITNGAVITIVDKSGTTSATINDGQNGKDGDDGFSPIATVSKITDGVVISIQDKNGITTENVKNGKDGEPGKDGENYVITEDDYNSIADVVLTKLVNAESVSV